MSLLRTNILANYAGQAWMAIMAVAFVPIYARTLGYEAFGLVGLMLSPQAISMLLDLGMGGVMNRELARRATSADTAASMRELTRTLEWIIWPMALGIAAIVVFLAPWMSEQWLHPQSMTTEDTTYAVRLMGFAVAAQWPSAFYTSGLSGLERRPAANIVNAVFATLRSAGAVAVLFAISATIEAFHGVAGDCRRDAIVGGGMGVAPRTSRRPSEVPHGRTSVSPSIRRRHHRHHCPLHRFDPVGSGVVVGLTTLGRAWILHSGTHRFGRDRPPRPADVQCNLPKVQSFSLH